MSVVVKVLAVVALVSAAVLAFIGVTLKGGGVLERGALLLGAALLVWLATRLRGRPA